MTETTADSGRQDKAAPAEATRDNEIVAAESAEPVAAASRPDPPLVQLEQLGHKRWVVLTAAFSMMMFLALPILWRSRAFTRWEKVWWSAAILLYSAVILGAFAWAMAWSIPRIYTSLPELLR